MKGHTDSETARAAILALAGFEPYSVAVRFRDDNRLFVLCGSHASRGCKGGTAVVLLETNTQTHWFVDTRTVAAHPELTTVEVFTSTERTRARDNAPALTIPSGTGAGVAWRALVESSKVQPLAGVGATFAGCTAGTDLARADALASATHTV
jgi:hypothetical protein